MSNKESQVIELLNNLPVSKWGVADLTCLNDPAFLGFPRAIPLLMNYSPMFDVYDEYELHHLLINTRTQIHSVLEQVSGCLSELDIKHLVVSYEMDPVSLTTPISHKMTATLAGLGWVGKSSLFISEDYGPRVRLATILVDLELPSSEPISESRCGSCRACVEACPYGCIKDVQWHPGIDRDLLLDAHTCSRIREEFRIKIGRKHTCGLCLLACPVG